MRLFPPNEPTRELTREQGVKDGEGGYYPRLFAPAERDAYGVYYAGWKEGYARWKAAGRPDAPEAPSGGP